MKTTMKRLPATILAAILFSLYFLGKNVPQTLEGNITFFVAMLAYAACCYHLARKGWFNVILASILVIVAVTTIYCAGANGAVKVVSCLHYGSFYGLIITVVGVITHEIIVRGSAKKN